MSAPRVPLVDVPGATVTRLGELGGQPINLYRALANQPRLLAAWIEFAWALRTQCATPRRLRELLILRGAQLTDSAYEWAQHLRMAAAAGVTEEEVAGLASWRTSERFTAAERAALAYAEAVVDGDVPEAVAAELAAHFPPDEIVELALTASFYAMVPRVLDALQVPVEQD